MSLRKFKRTHSKKAKTRTLRSPSEEGGNLLTLAVQHHQAGRLKKAELLYNKAIKTSPDLITAYNNLGVLLHDQGKMDEAASLYQRALTIAPDYCDALKNYGVVLKDLGELDTAAIMCQKALDINPKDTDALNNFGVVLHRQAKLDQAVASFQRALDINPKDVDALNNLGLVLSDQDKVDKAISCYQKALELNPHYFESLKNLGKAFQNKGKKSRAIFFFEKYLQQKPDDIEILYILGLLQEQQGKRENAIKCYEKILQIDPKEITARYYLAYNLEIFSRLSDARIEIEEGLKIDPDDLPLNILAAKCDRREGNFRQAIERLSKFDCSTLEPQWVRQINFEQGRLYERIEDSEKAFSHFTKGNQATATLAADTIDKNTVLQRLDCIAKQLVEIKSLPKSTTLPHKNSPVFLIGFPRSGTTLLDQTLDSHPKVQTLEEKEIVSSLENEVITSNEDYLRIWTELSEEDIDRIRKNYFQKADNFIERQEDSVFIDKFPLNINRASFIWRIFPDAKFILAIRHPLDVCLSCFIQDFEINPAMANFFTLEDAAHFYNTVMGLWKQTIDILPLNYHTIRYEDLVSDFETETRKVLDFIDVGWDESVLKFNEHALQRRINTPSYHQVTQSIYQHAKYRWKRYEKQVEPIKDVLNPFIEYFGYS